MKLGQNVVIVGGSGAAIATALYIIDKGKHAVSMVDKPKKFGTDVNPSYVWRYMKKLKEGNVAQVTQSAVKEIRDKEVVVEGPDKKETTIPADSVVLANLVPNKEIGYGKYAKDVYMIGDCCPRPQGNGSDSRWLQDGDEGRLLALSDLSPDQTLKPCLVFRGSWRS